MNEMDWEILKSRYIHRDKWVSLRVDTCRMPDGKIVEPFYVLEYPDWVNVVAVTDNQEMVMVREYRHGIGKTILGLPCGCVDESDPSPLHAAKRELLEETGYSARDFTQIGVLSASPGSHNNLSYSFLAAGVEKIAEPQPEETEQIEVHLMPFSDVLEAIDAGEIIQGLQVSAIFLALKKLGIVNVRLQP